MEQYIFVLKEMYKWYRKGLAMLGLEALETSLLVSKLHLNNNKLEKWVIWAKCKPQYLSELSTLKRRKVQSFPPQYLSGSSCSDVA